MIIPRVDHRQLFIRVDRVHSVGAGIVAHVVRVVAERDALEQLVTLAFEDVADAPVPVAHEDSIRSGVVVDAPLPSLSRDLFIAKLTP